MIEETNLRVTEAYHKDVGRGIARIDTRLMQQMGLISGDIIEILGKAKTYAIVWPNVEREQENRIRIDGNLRSNAKVGIDDRVTIQKVQAKHAQRVTLAPFQPVRLVGGAHYILRILREDL